MESSIKDGDYGMLVRQPCMWSGGIQPVKINLTPKDTGSNGTDWDVNSSMKLPISMCAPFAADYDGDEMTLFIVKDRLSIKECKSFNWPHGQSSPYKPDNSALVMPRGNLDPKENHDPVYDQAICSTLCWSDRANKTRVNKCHERWLTSRSGFIGMRTAHDDLADFMSTAMNINAGACVKSSLQSFVGATSRRSKLASEILTVNDIGIPLLKVNGLCWRHTVGISQCAERNMGWFGNPCLRAVSKLCASIMQITLKTKSTGAVESLSPTLSLLQGSESWLVLHKDGSMRVSTTVQSASYSNVTCTCSLMDISNVDFAYRHELCKEFVLMALAESNKRLDAAEMWCLITLVQFSVKATLTRPIGLELEIAGMYPDLNMVQRFNGCYVRANHVSMRYLPIVPSSTVECMMLSRFDSYRSILHE